ncbi:unnamed protein product [Phytophthora fragariaefolia]|uniref:Unnamed protein product n=1 Tax=Phytophthora fragariaefolia TaxID=1490495 RepID=A0A9W7CM48_9STRA|nr:unnamed protein product [Phytophthora fragariaefolia]
MTAGRQVATQSTAPMMVIRPRATQTALQPAAPEMAIQPRTTSALVVAIEPWTTSAPEMVRQLRAVETDSGPEDMQHLDKLQAIAAEGVRVELKKDVPLQAHPPDNHGSVIERVNILRKNVRKEQDAWRCLVLDLDLLAMWPEVFVSPFGIVDKAGGDPLTSGRAIHDLSFPDDASINDVTDQDAIPKADYRPCDAVASEILRITREHPGTEIKAMVGDVTSAFRNVPIHSRSGRYHLSTVAMVTGITQRFFSNYHWVDDHINVAADVGANCEDMERSLRYATTAILGSGAANEDKFTKWNTSQKILGLQFDTMQKQSQYQPPRPLRPAILSYRRTTQVDSHGKCIAPSWEVCAT